MKYKIGEVSKILGISRDLLRYYEERGVVSPEKDKNNDYRYYNIEDTNFLLDCLRYKNMGFSLEQTASLVHDCSLDDLTLQLKENEKRLDELLIKTGLLLENSRVQREKMDMLPESVGKYFVTERPAMYYYTHRQDLEYLKDEEIYKISQKWVTYLPFARRTFKVDVLGIKPHFQWGFSLPEKTAEVLGVTSDNRISLVGTEKCLYTVVENLEDKFSLNVLAPAILQIGEMGYKLSGDIFGNLIVSAKNEVTGRMQAFYEVWLPYKEKG